MSEFVGRRSEAVARPRRGFWGTQLMRHGEAALFGVLTVLGAVAAAAASTYDILIEGNRVGPGFLPLAAGSLVALSSGAALVRTVLRPQSAHDADEQAADDVDVFGRSQERRVRMLWAVFGILLATLLLVQVVGFVVAFGLFTVVVSTVVEGRPPWQGVLIGVVAAASIHVVFVEFFSVPLPRGVLGPG